MNGEPHGNAKWATEEHLRDAGFVVTDQLLDAGLLIGKIPRTPSGNVNPLHQAMYDGKRYMPHYASDYVFCTGDGHIITVAPTRSGKGTGLIIPNLLNCKDSVVVIDPKGENYEMTHDYRSDIMEQECWCFDPFKTKESRSMHGVALLKRVKGLFDAVDDNNGASSSLMAEVARIAEAIVVRQKSEKDPFFNDAAQAVIKDAILVILFAKKDRPCPPLSEVSSLINDESLQKELSANKGYFDLDKLSHRIVYEAVLEMVNMLSNRDVKVNTLRQIEFLQDECIRHILDGDLDYCDRRLETEALNGQKRISVYLIIPPQHLQRQSRFLRLLATVLMDSVMRRPTNRKDLLHYNKVLFVLDEIAQLGYLDSVQKAIALAAGYRMQLWMFWQDLSQMRGLYPDDWETFLSNARIQQFFGCNDITTARYISERSGPRTQQTYSEVDGYNMQGFRGGINNNITTTKIAGDLVRPSEILRADSTIEINFVQGTFPFLTERVRYYEEPALIGRIPRALRTS